MHRSKREKALHLLGSIRRGRNALIFYDQEKTLETCLFSFVKAGLERNEHCFYWAGINRIEDVEQKMLDQGLDIDHYRSKGLLSFLSYDDLFIVDGKLDLLNGFRRIFELTNSGNCNGNSRYRMATESGWWLLSDLFEKAMEAEATHETLPRNISAVCTYNIHQMLKYVNIYHLAKLMEHHSDTFVLTEKSVMLPLQFYSLLGRCIIDVLQNEFDYITIVRKKHSRFISEILLELEMRIGSDILELERSVEEQLSAALKANN